MHCELNFFFRINLKEIEKQGGPTDPYDFCVKHLNGDEVVSTPSTEDEFDPQVWIFNYPLVHEDLKQMDKPTQQTYNFNSLDFPHIISLFKKEPHVAMFLSTFSEAYGKENIQVCFGALVYDQHRFE